MLHADLLRKIGLGDPLTQRLGTGTFGGAYHVPWGGDEGSVLKITRDLSEVQASCILSGRDSKRIVHIRGVWALKDSCLPGLQRWYLIHRELLYPMSQLDQFLVETIFAIYDDRDTRSLTVPYSLKQHGTISKWRGYLKEDLGAVPAMYDEEGNPAMMGVKASPKDVKRALQLLLQIGQAMREMRDAGIEWEDIHSGNMMRNSAGQLVIADVGCGIVVDDFQEEIAYLSEKNLPSAA